MPESKLFKCYNPRFILMAMLAALLVVAAAFFERGFGRGSAPRLALAVVQALAMGGVIIASIVVIRRLDELQQRIHYEALALAFAATGTLISAWGFLEGAGFPAVSWGLWGWPLMVGLWAIGLLIVRRRYA
jgi:hypothetical protein